MDEARFVAYLTAGLGPDDAEASQRRAVTALIRKRGGSLYAEFHEPWNHRRPRTSQLRKAILLCRRQEAALVVACSLPPNRTSAIVVTFNGNAVVAECTTTAEANRVALLLANRLAALSGPLPVAASAERRPPGPLRPGNPNVAAQSAKAIAAHKARADAFAQQMRPKIEELQRRGIVTLQGIAEALNAQGVPTPRSRDGSDSTWYPTTVRNLLARLDGAGVAAPYAQAKP